MSPRTGRRIGDSGTREAILRAARQRFAHQGYDAASIRQIADDAGVDPALVHHFYGTKENLFVTAVGFPALPSELLAQVGDGARGRLGERLLRSLLEVWETREGRARLVALVRSAVSNDAAMEMLRQFLTSAILDQVAATLEVPDAELRASLVASQVVGLALARYVFRIRPLATAPADDVVAAVGPTLQRYLTGKLDVWSGAGS